MVQRGQRGRGLEQLDRLRMQESKNKMVPGSPFAPFNTSYTGTPNPIQFRPAHFEEMFFQPPGVHGSSPVSGSGLMDLVAKELSSIPNNVNCGPAGFGFGHKIDDGNNASPVKQFRNVCGDNTGVEVVDARKVRQVSGVKSVQGNGKTPMKEYEYFPPDAGSGDCCGLVGSIRRLFDLLFRKKAVVEKSQSYGVVRLLLEEY